MRKIIHKLIRFGSQVVSPLRRYPLLAAAAFVMTFATFALAQAVSDPPAPPDLKAVGANAIAALTPVLGVVVLWALKVAWSKIPASAVLIAAPVVGMLLNYGLSYFAGHVPGDPLAAAALGMLAVYLREFASTLASKGLSGPITPTKFTF